jgi:hypothetical protein
MTSSRRFGENEGLIIHSYPNALQHDSSLGMSSIANRISILPTKVFRVAGGRAEE